MFLVIVLRIVAIVSGDQDKAGKLGVDKFSMTALAALHPDEAGSFQIGNELANLARHMKESATRAAELPVLLFAAVQRRGENQRQGRPVFHRRGEGDKSRLPHSYSYFTIHGSRVRFWKAFNFSDNSSKSALWFGSVARLWISSGSVCRS